MLKLLNSGTEQKKSVGIYGLTYERKDMELLCHSLHLKQSVSVQCSATVLLPSGYASADVAASANGSADGSA